MTFRLWFEELAGNNYNLTTGDMLLTLYEQSAQFAPAKGLADYYFYTL